MIVVTGTFRSGTSMWMQILQSAGLPSVGTAFPAHWGQALPEFNADGFHESRLREGIWWKTNPHPETGAYLFPADTRRHVVKVFADGLVRSDVAFLDHVLVTLRDWRSFTRSFHALHAKERSWYADNGLKFPGPDAPLPAPYQWWSQNYGLVRDVATRRYPATFITFDHVLRDPTFTVPRILARLGVEREAADRAAATVKPRSGATTQPPHPDEDLVPPEDAATFDALFHQVDRGGTIGPALIDTMNETARRIYDRFPCDD